jgi:transposase
LNYLAAWDVHRANIFGRCEPKMGIVHFDSLVDQVMNQKPYLSADRVFWIVDNGSSHRGQKASDRLSAKWPTLVLVHTPIHASWLNQIEIYFSIIQRKVLTPNTFASLEELELQILAFQARYNEIASPFRWTFTRKDLSALMNKLENNNRLKAA